MASPEVSGMYVAAFLSSAGEVSSVFERKARTILEDHGIEQVEQDEWYDIGNFVDAMNKIEQKIGEKTSEQAGMKMMEVAPQIEDLSSMEEAIEVGQEPLRQSYRNYSVEKVGGFKFYEENGEKKVTYYGGWEYPESFTHGIFKGMADEVDGISPGDIVPADPVGDEVYTYVVDE